MVGEFDYKEEGTYEKDTNSINEIVLRHFRKIGDICCQEFTGGYWENKPIRTQSGIMFSKVYHEDVREAYCNAVDFLIDVIYPKGDKELKCLIEEHDKVKSTDIKSKLEQKRLIFKEINKMFARTNFWQGAESYNE